MPPLCLPLGLNPLKTGFSLLLVITLSACGGGGGGGGETPTDTTPVFTSGTAMDVAENTTVTGYTAVATDDDGDTVTYSLTGGTDLAAFSINSSSGVLSFNIAPDFESPTDSGGDNTYVVDITATDGANPVVRSVTVTVTDLSDSAPVFTSGTTISVAENNTTTGYTATATDADAGDTVTFSLTGGVDQAVFSINGSSGVLSFNTAPDFETPTDSDGDNTYAVDITATDGANPVVQSVMVAVTDLNDNTPVFTSGTTISVAENSTVTGYTAMATDADVSDTVTYSLTGGVDQALFSINGSSGVLSFTVAPDFEIPTDSGGDNTYVVNITATDGSNPVVRSVTVTVTDLNDSAPVFTSGMAISVAENASATGYTATATDADAGDTVTFSLTGGVDQAAFSINGSSGVLNFNTAPDFEIPTDSGGDNTYVVSITATDGSNPVVQSVTVTVTDLNDSAPVFTSGTAISVAENASATGYTATATDADAGDTVTYSLTGGVDQAAFSINGSSGVLSFNTAPDFETPTDSGGDNTYVVSITASDGSNPVVQSVTVTVTDLNDNAPVFTSGMAISVAENATATGYTATAIDADAGDTVTYSLTGGVDQAAFSINGSSGVLSFTTAPDFETPTDSGGDNTYVVDITATDGTNPVVQSVTITVTDVFEVTVSSIDIKTIRFDWSAYAGATNYKLFVNPDGASGFTLLQDSLMGASTTLELPVHLTDWINASYLLEAHDGGGKLTESDPISISALMLSSIGYVKASNTGAGDEFGFAVSLSGDGNTLAVGVPGEDSSATSVSNDGSGEADNSASDAGAVYVFSRSSGSWMQQAYVKASNAEAGDNFGGAVSLSDDGNILAVGAVYEDSNATSVSNDGSGEADNSVSDAGAVYVFSRSGTVWSQQAYVKASNTGIDDQFGNAVSLSADGNTLAVGAVLEDSNATGVSNDGSGEANNSVSDAGAVYVFSRSVGIWTQQAYVKASNTGIDDQFGNAVSLSADGNTLAVGAVYEDSNAVGVSNDGSGEADNSAFRAGAVYVFSRSVTVWSQQAYVKASNADAHDRFGSAISLSADGNTLAVGAYLEDSNATGVSNDGSGEADNSEGNAGAAYVFSRSGTVWSQQAYVKASNTGVFDWFGGSAISLSADGNTLAVGAFGEDSDASGVSDGSGGADNLANGAGAVYVFRRSGTVWSQQTYVKASNTELHDWTAQEWFGAAASLSADGSTLAVGARREESNAIGISGDGTDNSAGDAGAVYLY